MIRRVHFVEFNAKAGTLQLGLVFPKYGTALLAALLGERGYEARIFLEGVSDMSFARIADCDVVCLPVFAPVINKVRELTHRLRLERPGLPIILGGPHACLAPDQILDLGDIVVRCEGDEVLPEILDGMRRGEDWRGLAGLSYRDAGRTVHNPDRAPPAVPDTGPDLKCIEGFDRIGAVGGLRRVVNTLQTSRGCRFRCRFCPTAKLFGGAYRTRGIDGIIDDIRSRRRHNRVFFVVDNSFLGDREHALELLRRLEREQLGVYFIVFERHEIGRDDELLDRMRRAGVRCVIVGMESLNDANLRAYDKRQSSGKVVEAVENIQRRGLHVIGTFVLGGDNDGPGAGDDMVAFVRRTGISLNAFIVHDLEEDPNRELLIPMRRRFHTHYPPGCTDHYDYLTGSFVTYYPKRMRPTTLQETILSVYDRVYSHGFIARRMCSWSVFLSVFGVVHGYGIRAMNRALRGAVDSGYMDHLRRIEDGLYDAGENLIEERLDALQGLPSPGPIRVPAKSPRYAGLVNGMLVPGITRFGLKRCGARVGRLFARASAAW